MNSKNGFTLAEVLITLGIIGVVAAMTIPTLLANYRKNEAITKLKKSYTVINQAMKLSESQNGEFQYWETNLPPADYIEKYWKPYIKINEICTTSQKCNYSSNTAWTRPNRRNTYAVFGSDTWRIPFMTTDQTLYSISVDGGFEEGKNIILIDINGAQKPNVFGLDFFMFIRDKRGLVKAYGDDKTETEIDEDCTMMGMRLYCVAKIMKDGWEIKNDYPWQ